MDQKQHYINTRNQSQIDMNLAYELYVETEYPTPKVPIQIFQQLFNHWLQFGGSNLEKYFKHYDQKFNVRMLTKKDGSVLFL